MVYLGPSVCFAPACPRTQLAACRVYRPMLKADAKVFDIELAILRNDPNVTVEQMKLRFDPNEARQRFALKSSLLMPFTKSAQTLPYLLTTHTRARIHTHP